MSNRMSILLFALMVGVIGAWGATTVWIPGQSQSPINPNVNPFIIQVLSKDASGITLEVRFEGIGLIPSNTGNYSVQGDGNHQMSPGNLPHLPQWSSWIDLGRDDAGKITVLEQESRIVKGYTLENIRPGQVPFQNDWFPFEKTMLGEPIIFRDIRMASLSVFPVRIKVGCDELEVTSRMVIRIDLIPGQGKNPKTTPDRPIPYGFAKLYREHLLNPPTDLGDFIGDHLLIITPDNFVTNLDPMIQWKREKGIQVSVTRFSDIGASPSNPTAVFNHLHAVYSESLDVPDYVLFVGDEIQFPMHTTYTSDPYTQFSTASYPGWFINDNWYMCQEGNDYFPEFFHGRWVVNTTSEVNLLVAKVLLHEKNIFMQDSTWYEKAVVAADYEEPSMRTTKTWVKNLLLQHGFQRVDSVFNYGSGGLLASYVNGGRNYVNYRGAGWYYGWTGIPFFVENVEGLTNYNMLPIVTGIGCGVAKFDVPDDNCFGERWMTFGTIASPRGAAGFVGPTWNTHTYFNDDLDKGLYLAILDSETTELTPALVSGKMYLYDRFQPYFAGDPNVEELVRTAFNQYINLSDPQLELFTATPWRPQLTYPPFVMLGTHPLNITVLNNLSLPIYGIRVCAFYDTTNYAVGITDSQGVASMTLTIPTLGDSVTLTVTSSNVFPTQIKIPITPTGVLVVHHDVSIDDQTHGNGDGMLNPGEQVFLHETLLNQGNAIAINVQGTLTTAEPSVAILQNQAEFGNIAPDSTAVSSPDYEIALSTEYTAGDMLDFNLTLSDTTGEPWEVPFSIPLVTPNLNIDSVIVHDSNNGRWDVDETVELAVRMSNLGLQGLPESVLTLRCLSPYVTIHDSLATLPALEPGDTMETVANLFQVESHINTPEETAVGLIISLTYPMGTYTFSKIDTVSILIGLITASCPTPDDSLIYYAYDSGDTSYTEHPTYTWMEIAPDSGGPGTILPFDHTDQTITVDLPFTFQYYGVNYQQVSVSTDGWLAMGSTTETSYQNAPLPRLDDIPAMIAPFWDDLWNHSTENGRICTYNAETEHVFVVEYWQVSHYAQAGLRETFQVVFYDPSVYETETGDGEILFAYHDITGYGIASATTGIESPGQQNGISYGFNGNHPASAFGLTNDFAIKFTTDPPVVTSVPDGQTQEPLIPKDYVLNQNYPNPFNPTTTIRYGLPTPEHVTMSLFNILGQKVATLVDDNKSAGYHQVVWDGRNRSGDYCSAGIYFYRLHTKDFVTTKKMVLLK